MHNADRILLFIAVIIYSIDTEMITCGLFLIIAHPPSTTMHPMCILTAFGYKENFKFSS